VSEHPLDAIFHPRAVAVVGVPSQPRGFMGGFYQSLLEAGYPEVGQLYPINPKITDIDGVRCYPSLLDTPDPVDHVISQVPASAVPGLVDQCVAKKVRSIHFFTAGFSETGDEQMAEVERAAIAKLRAAGIRAIGPNCMGLYVPSSRLAFMNGFPMEPGNVLLLSQSGANAGEIVGELAARGIRFSKAISYGNGADLKAHDFLDYAATDPETEVVAAYIEGVQEGPAFFDALKRCARVKRTIVLKGGLTRSGSRAAHSHTGSLAGSSEIFDAVCRQTGAIRAETMEDLQDLVVAASTNTCRITGSGVALIGGGGGGFAVLSADAIDREGLTVPRMPAEAVRRMREFIPVAGSSVNNPIDAMPDDDHIDDMLRIVATAEGIDMVFMGPMMRGMRSRAAMQPAAAGQPPGEETVKAMEEASKQAAAEMRRLQDETGTPVVGIQRGGRMARMMGVSGDAFGLAAYKEGLGVYPSVARAARTVAQVLRWREYRDGLPEIL
jgi:acyl-CoA synthetase (NDP forming)